MRKSLVPKATLAILLCATIMSAAPSHAQVTDDVPHLINYQGRLTDAGGDPVTDGEYVVTFTIWSDSTSTAPTDREWISPNCTLLVVNGLFNWQLGSNEGLPPWTMTNDAELYLGVQVESDPEITPRTRLCSAPYAYKAWQAVYAEYADSAGIALSGAGGWVDDGNVIRLDSESDSVGIGTLSPTEKLDVVGTAQMTGLKLPTDAADGHVLTSDADGNGTWQAAVSPSCCQTRVGNDHGTGIIPVTFSPAFPEGVVPDVFATAVLTAASGPMGKGDCPYAEVSNVTNTEFHVTLKEEIGGSIMATAPADITYIAIGSSE